MNSAIEFDRIEAVLFDFDGTLVHLNLDFDRMRDEVEKVLERHGISTEGLDSLYTLELIEHAMERLAEEEERSRAQTLRREAEAAIVAVEMDAARAGEVHEGVVQLLQLLWERGIHIAIITRNCREAVEYILERNPLPHDALVTRDDVDQVKPHPEHLTTALRQLSVTPERALMVGDHPMDIKAGRVIGTQTVAVLTGYSARERFLPEEPDLILNHIEELQEYLSM